MQQHSSNAQQPDQRKPRSSNTPIASAQRKPLARFGAAARLDLLCTLLRAAIPEHVRRARDAHENAQACAVCGKTIKPGDPVWRKRIELGRVCVDGGWEWAVAPC